MLSVIILTHNNEDTIDKTLASVAWCDEILIIDDESTDATAAIAKKYNAVIHTHALANDFASQRNFGLKKATGDWVLYIDSDEVVSEPLKNEIREAVKQSECVAYDIPRKDIFMGNVLQHGETANIKLVRLAKKTAGSWTRIVHEIWIINGSIGRLQHPIIHTAHQKLSEFIADINYYSTLHATACIKEGKRMRWWQIIVYPKAKFIQNYIGKAGFLDGTAGMVMALMMSFHSFLTRGKMWEMQKKEI